MKFKKEYYSKERMNLKLNLIEKMYLSILKFFPFIDIETTSLLNIPINGKVLDVGCARGFTLNFLRKIRPDLNLYGLDLGEMDVPNFIEFTKGDVYKMPYDNDYFDYVICRHLLEHLDDPFKAISEITRVLKEGGELFVITPSSITTSLPSPCNFYDDPTHIRPYTPKSLITLFKISNLKIISSKSIYPLSFLAVIPSFLRNKSNVFSIIINIVFKTLVYCKGVKVETRNNKK